jgi:ribosomal protein S6--L-glutamate ligase
MNDKIIVGSEEWCAFPDLSVYAIKARVDSGAKTSSIHAFNITPFTRNDAEWVSFEVHPLQKNANTVVRCEAPVIGHRVIKSSNGSSEKRIVISTLFSIGDSSWEIELTLTNRDNMGYRMLLGREAMKGRILVDPSKSCCLGSLNSETIKSYYGESKKRKNGLIIGLLSTGQNFYSNQRLMEAADEHGHQIHFLDIKKCYIKMETEVPIIYNDNIRVSGLDAVITRIPPSMTLYGTALTRQLENMGVYTINSSTAINHSRDKLYSLQLFLKKGLEIPTTVFATPSTDTNKLIEAVGGAPLIVKQLDGSLDRATIFAETQEAAESSINSFKTLQAKLLLQEFVNDANSKLLHCYVVGGKVVASIQRQSAIESGSMSDMNMLPATAIRINADERSLAIKAVRALRLKFASVEIIRSQRGPLLLKIAPSAKIEDFESISEKDIAGLIISAIEKQLDWKRVSK